MRRKTIETPENVAENSTNDVHLLQLAADLVTSYVSHNHVPSADVGTIIRDFHASLSQLHGRRTFDVQPQYGLNPAVSIKKSIEDDHIICLEDGKKLKMLKRYLRSHFRLTPNEYRTKWRLPRDYPMVAPAYARRRSALAKESGLGTIPGGARPAKRQKA